VAPRPCSNRLRALAQFLGESAASTLRRVRQTLVDVHRHLEGFFAAGAVIVVERVQIFQHQLRPADERCRDALEPEARNVRAPRNADTEPSASQVCPSLIHLPPRLSSCFISWRNRNPHDGHSMTTCSRRIHRVGQSRIAQQLEIALERVVALRAAPVPAAAIAAVVEREDAGRRRRLVRSRRHPLGVRRPRGPANSPPPSCRSGDRSARACGRGRTGRLPCRCCRACGRSRTATAAGSSCPTVR
jgi:hypothetical protein